MIIREIRKLRATYKRSTIAVFTPRVASRRHDDDEGRSAKACVLARERVRLYVYTFRATDERTARVCGRRFAFLWGFHGVEDEASSGRVWPWRWYGVHAVERHAGEDTDVNSTCSQRSPLPKT